MINPDQLRILTKQELVFLNPALATDNAIELLMMTFAAETACGRWLWQHVPGSSRIPENLAYGIGQMEQAAYLESIQKILKYKPSFIAPPRNRLITDLRLAIWTTRCYYLRFIEPIPHFADIPELARYWKEYYNTPAGKGTVERAIDMYKRYVEEK